MRALLISARFMDATCICKENTVMKVATARTAPTITKTRKQTWKFNQLKTPLYLANVQNPSALKSTVNAFNRTSDVENSASVKTAKTTYYLVG